MRIDRLVSMANDIGAFFDAEPDKAEASRNIASHLKRFWDPRMRRQIVAHYREGGAGLNAVVRSAVALLADSASANSPQTTRT
jgi:formate dehydrogenase subunit delta